MNQKSAFLSILLLLNGVCATPSLMGQDGNTPSSTASTAVPAGWNDAPNRWQLTAIDPRSQVDTVNAAVRAQRNAYWRAPLEYAYNASKNAAATVSGPGSFIESWPELRDISGSAWVLATFQSFHTFSIDSDFKLIYTEINLRIDSVISQPDTMRLTPGTIVDVGIPGGTILAPSNHIVSSRVSKEQYAFQTNHQYLLQLTRDKELAGEFTVHKRWDVTSGHVKPDTPEEVIRASRGQSSLAGLSIPELINYLKKQLPDVEEK